MSRTHEEQRTRLSKKLVGLQERKFYGKVILDIQGGNLLRTITQHSERLFEEDEDGESAEEAQAHGLEDQEAPAEEKQAHQEA